MRATIRGIEVEGTAEEIAKLIFEIDVNKKLPPASTFPSYPMHPTYYPPTYVTPLPYTVNPDPSWPQVWCGEFSSAGSVTCKQDPNVQTYN